MTKEFEVTSAIEECIADLMMLNATHDAALELMMVQAAIRFEEDKAKKVRAILRTIEELMID